MSATQHSNFCHRTAMADTHFWSTPEGAGWTTITAYCGGCLACASCACPPSLLTAIAGNHVLWRFSNSEKLYRVQIRLGFLFFFVFFFSFELDLLLFLRKIESLFVYQNLTTCAIRFSIRKTSDQILHIRTEPAAFFFCEKAKVCSFISFVFVFFSR